MGTGIAMKHEVLIEKYLAGPEILRQSIAGMSNMQLDTRPIPFKWSARQVALHIAYFDLIYAEPARCMLIGTTNALCSTIATRRCSTGSPAISHVSR